MYYTVHTSYEMWALPSVTAYSKEIASIKNTRYDEPFSIESLKESASKWFEVYAAMSAYINQN